MPSHLLSIDVGSVCGYASGRLGDEPTHGTLRLPTSSVHDLLGARLHRLEEWLGLYLPAHGINLIVMAERFHVRNTGEAAVSFGLDGIVRMMAYRQRIQVLVQPEGTVRKELLGRGSGASDVMKALALDWCRVRAFEVETHHEADAMVLWHWTERELARQSSPQVASATASKRARTTRSDSQGVRTARRRTTRAGSPPEAAGTAG